MTRKLFFQVTFLLALIFSNIQCKSRSKDHYQPKPAAIALNNDAVMTTTRGYKNPDSLRKAIMLLDSAIVLDADYSLAYGHKAEYLTRLGETSRALETLNTYLRRSPTDPYILMPAGMLYDKMGKKDSAMSCYQRAHVYLKQRYEEDGDPGHELNRCILIGIIEGAEKGKAVYQKERSRLTSDEKLLKGYDDLINIFFDTPYEQYIKDFWTK